MSDYKPVIGLEVHIELATQSKMFCGCSAKHFGLKPNTNTCPICLGLPGALPFANSEAIKNTIKFGLSFNCDIALQSKFDRKHYFYPDLPKGYQISQYDLPLCTRGFWLSPESKRIRIRRIHLEEDTGKLIHTILNGKRVTFIDFNRSGVPLTELVTEPDFENTESVVAFLKEVQRVVRYLGISDCDMEKGSMRLEANLSVARQDSNKLPDYKVELKNINSFRFLKRAMDIEVDRQKNLLREGKKILQETRGYDELKDTTFSQRSKEEAQDYRYFPEPDIPPLTFSAEFIRKLKREIPELPGEKRIRFIKKLGVRPSYADIITQSASLSEFAEKSFRLGIKDKVKPDDIAGFLVNQKVNIKKVSPQKIISLILRQKASKITDEEAISKWTDEAITSFPKAVSDYKNGKTAALSVLIGRIMQLSSGKADPILVKKILEEKLNKL